MENKTVKQSENHHIVVYKGERCPEERRRYSMHSYIVVRRHIEWTITFLFVLVAIRFLCFGFWVSSLMTIRPATLPHIVQPHYGH